MEGSSVVKAYEASANGIKTSQCDTCVNIGRWFSAMGETYIITETFQLLASFLLACIYG